MRPLFVAILEDDSTYVGGTYEKTLWLEIPKSKKIKRLFYSLPDGDHLCLDMYDRYFTMIEATTDMSGKNAGKKNIEFAYVLGEKNNLVVSYKINLKEFDKGRGDIKKEYHEKNSPFILGLSKDGWR